MLLPSRFDLAAAFARHHRSYFFAHWAVTGGLAVALLSGQLQGEPARNARPVCQGPGNQITTQQVGRAASAQQTYGGMVSVLDARTGRLLCRYPLPYPYGRAALDPRTRRLFVVNVAQDSVSVLDTRTGHALRTVPVGHNPIDPVVDVQTGRVFVPNLVDGPSNNTVSVLDARTGAVLRTIQVQGLAVHISPLALARHAGRVFAADYSGGSLSMLDAQTGRVLRTIATPAGSGAMAVDEQRNLLFTVGMRSLSVLDAAGGRLVRTIALDRQYVHVAVDPARQRIVLTGYANAGGFGDTLVLDERTGRVVARDPIGAWWAPPVLDTQDGHVFVAADGLTTLDAGTGRLLHTAPPGQVGPQTGEMAVAARTGRVFVAGQDGLRMVDARTGAVLARLPVRAFWLTVDDRRGIVFATT